MCGIVGYIGPKNAVEVVLEGLKRLEYRGYDSAGVCFKNEQGGLSLHKKAGKLENLQQLLAGKNYFSSCCIGHTRWATHGEVNDANAHPHLNNAIDEDNCIAIVHNGIIENAEVLREELKAEYPFCSETDSEVFLALLTRELKKERVLSRAVARAFEQVEGNSAFVVQIKGTPEIVAIKRGAPLVCGINNSEGEVFVSSDPYALAGMATEVFFPQDDLLCILGAADKKLLQFLELNQNESQRFKQQAQEIVFELSSKGDFEHYMLKEIFEQPRLIRELGQYYLKGEGREILGQIGQLDVDRIHIVACGTAWHAGLIIKNYLEGVAGRPTAVELASEFRYRNPLLMSNDLGLFISQSGETADTLAAQKLCHERGLKTISIVNVDGSTLYRDCDENLLIRAGAEIGVASTKAFTLQVLTGRFLAYSLAEKAVDHLGIDLLAQRIDEILANVHFIKDIAEKIYNYKGFIFTGRGQDYPVALEGALKLKEIAYVHAEGYAAGELKHGPIALIDEEMVNLALVGPHLYDKTISNIKEVKARRGIIVTIGPANDRQLASISDYYIPLNYKGLGELAPIYANVVNQLLAYYMARFKGTDIDRPRNLAKSVTVE